MPLALHTARSVDHDAYPPEYLRDLLTEAKTIAVVGASNEPWRPSFGIMRYLQRAGYRIVPVNPFLTGQSVHGEPFRASLRDLAEPVDLVNVFRRPDAISEVVEDAIAVAAPALWLQLGIRNDAACARAEAAGMAVVTNRCISVEHARLRP
jgi:predicted CoA-binding protein